MGHLHQRAAATLSSARGLIVALAGSVGAGKSTVADGLACRLGGTTAGFGNYVRHLAVGLGEKPERSALQRIGQKQIEANSKAFILGFLDWASPDLARPFIIDGVRHAVVDAALRAWSSKQNCDYMLVIIDTSLRERAKRGYGGNERQVRNVEAHPVERGNVETLSDLAEVVVSGDGEPKEVIACIMLSNALAGRFR